jgi:TolB-like protein
MTAVALAAGYGGYRTYLHFNRVTIAVVRFHNETGAAAHDRIAGTLTDAVVVSLAGNPRYSVIGNSPLLRTDRIFEDVPSIAAALHVDYVLLGQLQNGDTGLVARAHFIRASDQSHLWAGRIDLAGAPATEEAVTTAVAAGVATGLTRR